MRVHMHIRITDCFFPQHLLMWVSLTSRPEHTARQCRNFTFPATAVKRQESYCNYYHYYYCGSLIIACITANMHIVKGMSACITGNMHIVMHIALHNICISGNAYTQMRVHMHIRIADCFFPQHLLMWVSLTSSPEHTARQFRNFTFPATAVKWQKSCYCYYYYCYCGPLIIACITANMHICSIILSTF